LTPDTILFFHVWRPLIFIVKGAILTKIPITIWAKKENKTALLRLWQKLENWHLDPTHCSKWLKTKKIITHQGKKLSLTAMSKTKCICARNRLVRPLFYGKGQMVWNFKSCIWKPELNLKTTYLYFLFCPKAYTFHANNFAHCFYHKAFSNETILCSVS